METLFAVAMKLAPYSSLTLLGEFDLSSLSVIGAPATGAFLFTLAGAALATKKKREWRKLQPYMAMNNDYESEEPLTLPTAESA